MWSRLQLYYYNEIGVFRPYLLELRMSHSDPNVCYLFILLPFGALSVAQILVE
jgi:hypothetical protein